MIMLFVENQTILVGSKASKGTFYNQRNRAIEKPLGVWYEWGEDKEGHY